MPKLISNLGSRTAKDISNKKPQIKKCFKIIKVINASRDDCINIIIKIINFNIFDKEK